MRLYASRIMCHDDIRAIRKVYQLPVRRTNIQYDDTCRRDFPMNSLQKISHRIHRILSRYLLYGGSTASFVTFFITVIYLILKNRLSRGERSPSRSSSQSDYSPPSVKKGQKPQMNAFLWHDDLPFN